MQGDGSADGSECFYKLESFKQLFTKETGYCKLAPDAYYDTVEFTGAPDITTSDDCKVACEESPTKCWAFQFLKKEAVPADRSISQCTLFHEWINDLKGDGSGNVDCYIQERTTQE